MAVSQNKFSEIDDSAIIVAGLPVSGVQSFTGYIDDTENEDVNKFFFKEFRYSLDGGLNYGNWIELTNTNVQNIPIDTTYDFLVEYRYTRKGSDDSGDLIFNSVDLQGTYIDKDCGPVFTDSIFSYFFECCCSSELLPWCLNALGKMYSKGIVPEFLTRNENNNENQEDRDYIDFWRTLCCFWSLIVNYARKFEKFYKDKRLLAEYLKQRNIFLCGDEDLVELLEIMSNYYKEMSHRGTWMIAKKKGEMLPNGNTKNTNGELLRLLCYKEDCDEFLLNVCKIGTISWHANNWSPLYKGLDNHNQFVKLFEYGKVSDLNNYPIKNPSYVSVIDDSGEDVISINNVPVGEEAGIGDDLLNEFDTNVDHNLTYELSFDVKFQTSSDAVLLARYKAKSKNGIILNMLSTENISTENEPLGSNLKFPTNGLYYNVKIITYPYTKSIVTDPETNYIHGNEDIGHNNKFSEDTCRLGFEILLDNTLGASDSGEIRIKNIKFQPAFTEYSTGFVTISNFTKSFTKNNSSLKNEDITRIKKRYLFPYSLIYKPKYL